MSLYDLKEKDLIDLHQLISCDSLTIMASQAARVTQLQVMLRSAKPSTALEECKERCEMLEKQNAECLRVRDAALLEAGLAKRRADELEALYGEQKIASTEQA